jgi:uncharacterized membrane protein
MLVVIFNDEKKAYEGARALAQLEQEGAIFIYAEALIWNYADGTLNIKQADSAFPIRTVMGTSLGSLLGLLGGPLGVAIGAAAGAAAGAVADVRFSEADATFLDDVSTALQAGRYAVVADVSEESVSAVDRRMRALGGSVHRMARGRVAHQQGEGEAARMRAALASLKAEQTKAQLERQKHLQTRIEQLEAKLQAKLEHDRSAKAGTKGAASSHH